MAVCVDNGDAAFESGGVHLVTPEEAKKKTVLFVAEFDEAELALRLMCEALGIRWTKEGLSGSSREHILRAQRDWPSAAGPFPFLKMARIAIGFFSECIEKGSQPS